jgi:hypothetical protein
MFFTHFATYRQLFNDRYSVLSDLKLETQVVPSISGNFLSIDIRNESAKLLATFSWKIVFQLEHNKFVESYKVSFTTEGTIKILPMLEENLWGKHCIKIGQSKNEIVTPILA